MDKSHNMRHSSKNAIPTKPQEKPAIAQNFHIKKKGGKEGERRRKRGGGGDMSKGEGEEREERGSSGGGGGVGMPSSRQTTALSWDL